VIQRCALQSYDIVSVGLVIGLICSAELFSGRSLLPCYEIFWQLHVLGENSARRFIRLAVIQFNPIIMELPLTPEDLLKPFLGSLAFGIDIAVGVVIAISVIRGFIMYVKLLRRSPLDQSREEEGIKHYVGNGLILALDLEVGSDIIRTILAPSESDLISLVVIVAIRITLSWSLSRDIKRN